MSIQLGGTLSSAAITSAGPGFDGPNSTQHGPAAEVCIPNISAPERLRRLRGGIVTMVISLAVLSVLISTGVDHWWRLALFPLFGGAAVGFFQWYDKT
jgi:hypothetical protein